MTTTIAEREVALIDLIDRLLGGGVVIVGDITLAVARSIASAATRYTFASRPSASLISTRLSSARWPSTSIGVPFARCLKPRIRLPAGARSAARTFRANRPTIRQLCRLHVRQTMSRRMSVSGVGDPSPPTLTGPFHMIASIRHVSG